MPDGPSVVIRMDAGGRLGFGHAIRCLSLARRLRSERGGNVCFWSRSFPALERMFRKDGFEHTLVPDSTSEGDLLRNLADAHPSAVLVIDSLYDYTAKDILQLEDRVHSVMLQNPCDGAFLCDYAFFPSANVSEEVTGDPRWSSARAKLLYGPEYVLINEDVLSLVRAGIGGISDRIVITTGASDPEGVLLRALRWLNASDLRMDVLAMPGFDFSHRNELDHLQQDLRPNIQVRDFDLAELFTSRLAVCAFGVTTYELVFAGVPVITLGHIRQNDVSARTLEERYGCVRHLGLHSEVAGEAFLSCVSSMWGCDSAVRRQVLAAQRNLIDGKGMDRLMEIIVRLGTRERKSGLPLAAGGGLS